MPSEAQLAANRENAQASTGPRTPEGKAQSAPNATKFGLFSGRDFIRPDEHDTYRQFRAGLLESLRPKGALEETIAAEIVHAAWRLRRCSEVEASLSPGQPDPMQDFLAHHTQDAVDRARNQANRLMHRNIAEFRRLQTERGTRDEVLPEDACAEAGLTNIREVTASVAAIERSKTAAVRPQFTNRTQITPRNAACRCGSGLKYKRCCGKNAPVLLGFAA